MTISLTNCITKGICLKIRITVIVKITVEDYDSGIFINSMKTLCRHFVGVQHILSKKRGCKLCFLESKHFLFIVVIWLFKSALLLTNSM